MLTLLKLFSGCMLLFYFLAVALLLNSQKHLDGPLHFPEVPHLLTIDETFSVADSTARILQSLVQQNFFRYFRVDMTKECRIPELSMCRNQFSCVLSSDKDPKVPQKWLDEDQREKDKHSISPIMYFDVMKPHSLEDDPCNAWSFDQLSDNSIYVDLQVDREMYTGYQGAQIWTKIYEENCWNSFDKCNDNKFLYRMISGMHTSVSSHLTEYYNDVDANRIYANYTMYYDKVGNHADRMSNLLFAVNIMWFAFNRFADRIMSFEIDTGELLEDVQTKSYLGALTDTLQPIKDYFFEGKNVFGRILDETEQKRQFNKYFTDITKLMDCVECKKCKVYGKMQILGIGTALRILLNEDTKELTRNELVAFVNTIAKWTESVQIIKRMKSKAKEGLNNHLMYLSGLILAIMLFTYHFSRMIVKLRSTKIN